MDNKLLLHFVETEVVDPKMLWLLSHGKISAIFVGKQWLLTLSLPKKFLDTIYFK